MTEIEVTEIEATTVRHSMPSEAGVTPLAALSPSRVWGMLESAPDGMMLSDAHGMILAVNQQVEALFGYDRVDLLGQKVEMLLPERLRDVHRAHRTRYRAEPNVRAMGQGLELRARRHDGTEFPVEVSLSPLDEDEGLAVVVSIRDVSERQRVTAHTRRVQAAIDAVHDGVFMFEPDTLRFVYANDGASIQTGYSHEELLAMTPLHIKPEFTRQQFEALIAPLVAGEVDHLAFRTIHRMKSGRDVPVDIVLEHRQDAPAGRLEATAAVDSLLVAIVRDITDQVAVERQLALSEETFRASFEHAPVGMTIAVVASDGKPVLEQVNESFARMLGRPVDSLVGTDFVDLLHPGDKQQSIAAWAEIADGTRSAFITEKRYVRLDGSYVWALVHSSVIEHADSVRTLTHIVDITDRRARQSERSRMATMEERERIARDIHDLVIQRLFGAGMKLQAVIPEMGSEAAVSRAHETIDELDTTIRELRSAIFSLQRRDSDRSPSDVVTLAVEQSVDRLGFRPVVTVVGALDAVPPGHLGELAATLREALSNVARHADATRVEVRIEVTDGALVLTVDDDGRGVDDEYPAGNGVRNMAERARRFGGNMHLGCGPSGGCALTWRVPAVLEA